MVALTGESLCCFLTTSIFFLREGDYDILDSEAVKVETLLQIGE